MTRGTDIANSLPATHTMEREDLLLSAVRDGHIATMKWVPVPVEHTFHDGCVIRGTFYVAERALRVGDDTDSFRPNCNQITFQYMADALATVPAACAPGGVLLPTAKMMDAAALEAEVVVAICTQTPDSHMADTDRMIEHSQCVDRSIGGRRGLTNTEGKGFRNTNRLVGHPDKVANYGLYTDSAPYRGVLNVPLWQPDPGVSHFSGYQESGNRKKGFTDYSQVGEKWVLATMDVEGMGSMSVKDVARHSKYCWLISTEGPVEMRHPGANDPDKTVEIKPPPRPAPKPQPKPQPRTQPIFSRTMRFTMPPMSGSDVSFLQGVIGAKVDGVFGGNTEVLVKKWQRDHLDVRGNRLDVDGVVGPATRRAILASVSGKKIAPQNPDHIDYSKDDVDLEQLLGDKFSAEEYDPSQAAFLQARHYKRGVIRDTVHWLVLHSAEAAELPSTAEALMKYCNHMSDGREASWHWSFDSNSACRSLDENRIAFHAKKANRFGVGYEHAGYARQTRAQWLDDYSASMLWISACTAAKETLPRWDIPPDNFVTAAGLKRAYSEFIDRGLPVPNELRGVTTHEEVSKGLGGTHLDPYNGWPDDVYMDMIKEAA